MGLSASELQSLRQSGSARPLRASTPAASGRMERIMQTCMVKVAGYHMDFLGKVFEAIGAPSLATIREGAKAVTVHERGCACCSPSATLPTIATKADPVTISFAVDAAIDRAASQLFSDIWGVGTDIHAQTPIQKTLHDLVKEAVADGYANAEKPWKQRAAKDEAWALSNPFPDAALVPTPEMSWMKDIYNGGFTQVKDHVFKSLVPGLKKSIVEQLGAGLTVREVAENLYSSHGPGGAVGPYSTGSGHLWQWQRLIRTESHNAVFSANNEEFKDFGAKYVQWSRATNSSKCKCIEIAAFNQGYYAIDNVPDPPHPNCRCSTNPVFNLPKGITVSDGAPKPKPLAPEPTPSPEPPVAAGPVGAAGTGTGKVKITGKHSFTDLELAALEAHANANIKELGINHDIDLKLFSEPFSGNRGSCPFPKGGKGNATLININSEGAEFDKIKGIVSHELRHAQQMSSEKLYYTRTHIVWDGKDFIDNKKFNQICKSSTRANWLKYRKWPWEVDARTFAGQEI